MNNKNMPQLRITGTVFTSQKPPHTAGTLGEMPPKMVIIKNILK
jgi:hypothetical protein